jgi:hypothetical protein
LRICPKAVARRKNGSDWSFFGLRVHRFSACKPTIRVFSFKEVARFIAISD